MDIDLNAIEKQLGIGGKKAQNDDDLEEDETLLAELMELQDKTSQSTKEQSAEEDDGDDDETLLAELMGFQDETSKPKKVEPDNKNTRQPTIQQNEQPPKPKPPTQQNEQPKPKSVAPTPAPPPSTSLNDTGIKPTIQQNEQPKPKTIAAPLPPPSSSSLNDRAKSLLMHRRKMYLERAKAAKEANDRATAVDAFETVKLFNQALEAMNEGAELTEEDLTQIPPSPPPYDPPKNSTGIDSDIKNVDDKKPKETEIQTANRKKENNIEKEGPSNVTKMLEQPHISEELRLALMRQIQLKKEAMEAKKRGNIEKAKEFLTLAHRMDQMIEAAKCGLPIDIQQIPAVQSTSKAMTPNSLKRSTIGSDTLRKCQLLERELLKQIEFCQEKAAQFQTVGDSKNILFYEELQRKCKVDLHIVQMAMLGNSTLPGFSFGEILLPNIELNPSIGEDQLQLKISRIENLQLPQGWKPSDCSIFVFFKFPFPHGSQQTGRTTVIRGTISPEFPDIFQLKINRKTKQFARICKRIPLKLEIFNKGGFLRSDKPFGHAEVGLEELERTALVQRRCEILDGRKKTGGFIHIEIRINKPLGTDDNANNSGTIGIKRKWIELQH